MHGTRKSGSTISTRPRDEDAMARRYGLNFAIFAAAALLAPSLSIPAAAQDRSPAVAAEQKAVIPDHSLPAAAPQKSEPSADRPKEPRHRMIPTTPVEIAEA